MSIIEHAKAELNLANVDPDAAAKIVADMELFFYEYDSGGAVAAMFHTIDDATMRRLVAAKPLTPLTGNDDEWMEVTDGVFQNRRCSSVFKENDGAYDIDVPGHRRFPVTFPYMPDRAVVDMPVFTIS